MKSQTKTKHKIKVANNSLAYSTKSIDCKSDSKGSKKTLMKATQGSFEEPTFRDKSVENGGVREQIVARSASLLESNNLEQVWESPQAINMPLTSKKFEIFSNLNYLSNRTATNPRY